MKLKIVPLEGVSELNFGLTAQQVKEILGPPEDSEIDNSDGELREFRRKSGLQTVYSDRGARLVEIGFSRNITELEFDGVRLFQVSEEDALAAFRKRGARAHEVRGFLVFLDLGVTLTGFHDGASDQLAVTVFERGRWDDAKEDMNPYRL